MPNTTPSRSILTSVPVVVSLATIQLYRTTPVLVHVGTDPIRALHFPSPAFRSLSITNRRLAAQAQIQAQAQAPKNANGAVYALDMATHV